MGLKVVLPGRAELGGRLLDDPPGVGVANSIVRT